MIMKMIIRKIIVCPLNILLLIGFLQAGNGDVLCIGADGHVEIKTECLPCCNVSVDDCILDKLNNLHDEHVDGNNCSDLALDGPLWPRRFTEIIQIQSVKSLTAPTFHNAIILAHTHRSSSQIDKFLLTFSQDSPPAFMAFTILRC